MDEKSISDNRPEKLMPQTKLPEEDIINILKVFYSRNEIRLKKKIGHNTYLFIDKYHRKLLQDSILMNTIFAAQDVYSRALNDFSIIVFPSAKAMEGYIKKLLLFLKLITEEDLKSNPYKSIGRILDGDDIKNRLLDKKRDKSIPKLLSAQWDLCRNQIMHFDTGRPDFIKKEDASTKIENIYEVMKKSFRAFIDNPDKLISQKKTKGLTVEELEDQITKLQDQLFEYLRQLNELDGK